MPNPYFFSNGKSPPPPPSSSIGSGIRYKKRNNAVSIPLPLENKHDNTTWPSLHLACFPSPDGLYGAIDTGISQNRHVTWGYKTGGGGASFTPPKRGGGSFRHAEGGGATNVLR